MPKLKRNLSKEAWEELSPALQECYVQGDDGYSLNLDGREKETKEDNGELLRAKTRVQQERDEAREALAKANERLQQLETDDAVKNGDIKTLTEQWKKEKSDLVKAHKDEAASLRSYIEKTTIDAAVNGIAARNTGSAENAELLAPHLRQRLTVDFTEDGPNLVVLDADGRPTDSDLTTFEQEVVDNPRYGSIIVANRASGGGATEDTSADRSGGAASTGGNTGKQTYAEMSPQDLVKNLPTR